MNHEVDVDDLIGNNLNDLRGKTSGRVAHCQPVPAPGDVNRKPSLKISRETYV